MDEVVIPAKAGIQKRRLDTRLRGYDSVIGIEEPTGTCYTGCVIIVKKKRSLMDYTIVISGVTIFVFGQLLLKFFIDPIHQLLAHIGEIAHLLVYHSDVFFSRGDFNTPDQARNASQDFRKAGSELLAKNHVIHLHWLWSTLRILPKKKNIFYAHIELIGLSNGVLNSVPENNTKRLESIKGYLSLYPKMLT